MIFYLSIKHKIEDHNEYSSTFSVACNMIDDCDEIKYVLMYTEVDEWKFLFA